MQTGEEDDPGDAPFHQLFDQFVLGGAARRLGAQHRRVAVPGQRLLDDLGERGEDGVGQLGDDQSDQTRRCGGAAAPDARSRAGPGRPAPCAGAGRHARLAVEHPADGRLADLRLRGDVRQPYGRGRGHPSHHTAVSAGSTLRGRRAGHWRAGPCRAGGKPPARRVVFSRAHEVAPPEGQDALRRLTATPRRRPRPAPGGRGAGRSAARYSSRVESGSPVCASTLSSAQSAGCGSQLPPPPKPYEAPGARPRDRHPAAVAEAVLARRPWKNDGSWRTSSGRSTTSGRPSSSPW